MGKARTTGPSNTIHVLFFFSFAARRHSTAKTPSVLENVKINVSLVWAISRRNVVIGKYLPAKKRAVLMAHHHHRVGLMGDERNREGKGTSVCQQYILYSLCL